MPNILSNCQLEDEEANIILLDEAYKFPQSQETLVEILERIARKDKHLNLYYKIVRHAEPRLLEVNLPIINEFPILQKEVSETIALISLSTRELWDLLLSYAEKNAVTQPIVKGPKIGRNDPCPCGSGKKYKKCSGNQLNES